MIAKLMLTLSIILIFACTSLPQKVENRAISSKAEIVVGNGGYAMICKNGKSFTVELLDIYDGKINGMIFQNIKEAYNRDRLMDKLFSIELTERDKIVINESLEIDKYKVILPRNVGFSGESKDSNPEFIHDSCELKQIAMYKKNDYGTYGDGKLYVIEKYWNKMDTLNKIALILHEAVYRFRREYFYDADSKTTRLIVGLMLAEKNGIHSKYNLNELFYTKKEIEDIKLKKQRKNEFEKCILQNTQGLKKEYSENSKLISGKYSSNKFCDISVIYDIYDKGYTVSIRDVDYSCKSKIELPIYINLEKCDQEGMNCSSTSTGYFGQTYSLKIVSPCSFKLMRKNGKAEMCSLSSKEEVCARTIDDFEEEFTLK